MPRLNSDRPWLDAKATRIGRGCARLIKPAPGAEGTGLDAHEAATSSCTPLPKRHGHARRACLVERRGPAWPPDSRLQSQDIPNRAAQPRSSRPPGRPVRISGSPKRAAVSAAFGAGAAMIPVPSGARNRATRHAAGRERAPHATGVTKPNRCVSIPAYSARAAPFQTLARSGILQPIDFSSFQQPYQNGRGSVALEKVARERRKTAQNGATSSSSWFGRMAAKARILRHSGR